MLLYSVMSQLTHPDQGEGRQATFAPKVTHQAITQFYVSESHPIVSNYSTQAKYVHSNPIKSQVLLFLSQVRIAVHCHS